ncbi:alpha/beta fold hydrolase [Sphingomonas sp.]|uniref:alpha/beta fold hydrolase n=1 Tax=Sphingomonas sp. TaxID=28214 RepID=UPI00345BA10B
MLATIVVVLAVVLGAAFLLFRTPDTDPAAMRAKYGGPPSQFVDLGGGLNIHLRDTGPRNAPVLMLIHGSNASLHTWEPWAKRLEQQYRIIRFDLPGHGLTGPHPRRDYTMRSYADVVEQLRLKLHLARFVIAGNSMGGSVAWHYALWHPERVRALILVDSGGQPEPMRTSVPLGFRIARTPVLRYFATQITPRALIESTLDDSFTNRELVTPAMVDRYWELLRYPGNRQATVDRFSTRRDPASPARLQALKMPVLILWGADDKLIPVSSANWFAQQIPDHQVIIYPATGHVPMEERADESARDVLDFLSEHTADR